MTLYQKIIALYPELDGYNFCKGDIELRNDLDERGDYIAKWEHPTLARPTDEQLEAAGQ
jgi:hypothetical protein|tara:strand:+ start:504 stop:680 length:177 start_codon:yes stop_codon:yes gene_type:complete